MSLSLFSKKKKFTNSRELLARGDHLAADAPKLSGDPLKLAMQLGRFGHMVRNREQWRDHPDAKKTHDEAVRAIDEDFAFVPEGFVSLPMSIFDQPGCPETDCETEPFLLSRHAVTNARFQNFVDGGGYEDLELWPEEIWPHLIDFKDQGDTPAPRYWRDGRHDRRLADHPVVGICYYEAAAYAQWAGFRLPSEIEWQMAASWRIRSAAHVHRRYPWGEALDLKACNIWASGHAGTVPVDAYVPGAAPNGVLQLTGNTWEWTDSDFECTDRDGRQVVGDTLLKSIRGGAFDTYFPWQAASTFRSGLTSLSRVHNVGFRCAMDLLGG